jgi:hypothetical protein
VRKSVHGFVLKRRDDQRLDPRALNPNQGATTSVDALAAAGLARRRLSVQPRRSRR